MSYAYYPGCSARGTGRPYEDSLNAVLAALGTGLDEIDDWNCCGSSAYSAVDVAKAVALSARNLALAERARPGSDPVDVVVPCAGCYRALLKGERALAAGGALAERVQDAFGEAGLRYEGRARTRHPVDILANDIGVERLAAATRRPLRGLRVACYYGCLLVRPYATFDDQRHPTSMERIISAVGGEPVEWPFKTRGCGGSCYCGGPVIGPLPDVTLKLSFQLLQDAKRCGAEAIATACMLCQFNLEAFQGQMERTYGEKLDLTVGFLSQFVGLALGIDRRSLGIHRMMRWHLPEADRMEASAHAGA